VDVLNWGRQLRYHTAFGPKGTNANFVQVTGPASIKVRTYERGVEDETLACGTGSVAAAILMARLGQVRSPVAVSTRGGDVLSISFKLNGDQASDVFLKGQADVTFQGTLDPGRYGAK
jgi:diaminopimelate epimerase